MNIVSPYSIDTPRQYVPVIGIRYEQSTVNIERVLFSNCVAVFESSATMSARLLTLETRLCFNQFFCWIFICQYPGAAVADGNR